MNKDTADLMFETLEVVDKHTTRLDKVDKQIGEQRKKVDTFVESVDTRIQDSTKDTLLQLLLTSNGDKNQLIRDVSNAIAVSLSELVVKSSEVTVNVETDAIAKAISKLPINNTNNITVDTESLTKELTKDNKQFVGLFKELNTTLLDTAAALKVIFKEMVKEKPVVLPVKEVKEVKENTIVGMKVKRNSDNLIESVDFIRSTK